jgi:hypothetical protein
MQGMSLEQFSQVVEFVQEYHKFGYTPSEKRLKKKSDNTDWNMLIKYVDSCYDSRDKTIWSISFRGMGNDLSFRTNHFAGLNSRPKHFIFESLFDWVMAFLKGEWSHHQILKECQSTKQ